MSDFLIKVLVAQCGDVERTLDVLCWPSCACPAVERVEALRLFIRELVHTEQSGACSGFNSRESFICKLHSVIWNNCVPLLKLIPMESIRSREDSVAHSGERKEMLHATCALLMMCVRECQTDTLDKLFSLVLPAFSGKSDRSEVDLGVAVEVLAVLLSGFPSNTALTKKALSCTLGSVKELSDTWVSKITVRIWCTCLNSLSPEMQSDILHHLWVDLLGWYEREPSDVVTSRLLLCLTALSDFLFSPDQTASNPLMAHPFFRAVQAGLVHKDTVSRKRALYLLNRCLSMAEARNADLTMCEKDFFFKWRVEQRSVLQEFWKAYALVLETLEEYQIHVIRPVLSRIDTLVQTTSAGTQGGELIHPSWLLCVYQRMFHSENKAVIKEGVMHLLGLQMPRDPAFAFAFSQFVVGPLVDVLAETSLYHRSAENVGECPEVGLKLQNFMVMFFSSLPEDTQGSVLLQILERLNSRRWCSVPLLFLSQTLSCLSPCPLLKTDGLHILREVLGCTMVTHHVLLRGAVQCFLLETVLRLSDVSEVSLDEVFGFLSHFRAEESLCPGTKIWEKVCDWLMVNEEAFQPASTSTGVFPQNVSVHSYHLLKTFLTIPAGAEQTDRLPIEGDAELLARTLLFSVTLDWRRSEKQRPGDMGLEELFGPLLDVLQRLNTSVYLSVCKIDKCLQLMLRLLVLLGRYVERSRVKEDKMVVALTQLLLGVAEPVQEFILRRLSGELQEFSDIGRANLYLSLLREMIKTYIKVPSYGSNLQKNYVSRLTINCVRLLKEPSEQNPSIAGQVQKAVSMATLALLCELADKCLFDFQSEAMRSLCSLTAYFCPSSPTTQCFNQSLLKPSSTADVSGCLYGDPLLRDWSKVVAFFLRDQWTCLSFLQKFAETHRAAEAFQAAVEALSLLPSDLVLPVLDFMCAALPQVLHEEALCVQGVSVSWRLVHSLNTNAHDFWPVLRAFVRLALHRSFLELQDVQSHKITGCIQQVTRELIELSQAKLGVLNVLIEHCCSTWLPSDPNKDADTVLQSALNHLDTLTEACIYGPIYRRDQRLLLEVQTYVEQLGEELAANVVINSWVRDDQFPRLCVLAFLSHLDPYNSLHQRLMENLVQCLLKKDKDISKSKVRHYSNSMQHRVKNRVWQTLLFLLPKLRTEFVVEYVFGLVCEAGFGNNQPSVKYLIEWVLILILHQNPSQIERLWVCFNVDQEKTKTSICTFLSVLVHLGILLPKLEDKARQWQKAVEVILLWCFSHNFTVRLYALLALKRVWGLEGVRCLAEKEQYGSGSLQGLATVVEACLHQAEVMQNTGNAIKNWSRIQEHFFFSAFHPLNDYSLETIFHTFPILSEMTDDECIPIWKFEKLVDFKHLSSLPLKNIGRELKEIKPGDWVQQDRGELEQEERWVDVQKKIAPWSLNVEDVEPDLVVQQRGARLGKPTTALLVVASLIDKPTNLGGLCRTCEIFGASALVLGGLHHVGDKQFQALSVSSELWLPLMEVKPMDLAGFLQLKQREGYSIIGVEQTVNSQSLQNYRFPEKTLLLLGNEREGIPVDLLQLLDTCVEIPQQGVTRSLNVHVSAALLVWEYTRQHLGPDQFA
ncbi:putative methyltransferase TARBP1 isoform 1-T1 [Clarias gariepinus]|uniref:probable methyltransferase TARBP1 isoform X1 n=1 Tax=Clarias gariepinus TaxID=13013 RepID=UPI00234D89F6|nr:probable methyltransferase TARBP1 isoform X1 [Clarias gariepinus]